MRNAFAILGLHGNLARQAVLSREVLAVKEIGAPQSAPILRSR
jgi:hypothetical protein